MADEILRYCKSCNEPKFVMRDGKQIQRRCKCDWSRGFYERVVQTIEPEYWLRGVKTMADWKPGIFKLENAGAFHRLINFQKVETVRKLYEFCFRNLGEKPGHWQGIAYGIHRSVGRRRNLFIHGPPGSGKGLLMACVKTLCAMKNVSVTPISSAFAVFRTRMINSEAFGKDGDEAKVLVSQCYANVNVMALEDVKAEHRINSANMRVGHVSRASVAIDSLIARRETRPGSVMMSSTDFAGEIGDSLGDKMAELLESDDTDYLLMLDAREAEALLGALQARQSQFQGLPAQFLSESKVDGRNMQEGMSEEQRLGLLREALYFDEAFKYLSEMDASREKEKKKKRKKKSEKKEDKPLVKEEIKVKVGDAIGTVEDAYPDEVVEVYHEFLDAKKNPDSLAYRQGVELARVNAIRSCKELAPRLGDREASDLASMVSRAASMTKEEMRDTIISARKIRDEMAGKGEGG